VDSFLAALEAQAVPLSRGEAVRTTDAVARLVADAVARYARSELVNFDVILQAMPDQPREGETEPQWKPMILIYVDIAGPGGLDRSTRVLNVSNPLLPFVSSFTPEVVDGVVQALLDGCFAAREEQIATMTRQAEQAMGNGRGAPQGGLITPR
jgi:hypothetical protein